jgi:hypothetical protein
MVDRADGDTFARLFRAVYKSDSLTTFAVDMFIQNAHMSDALLCESVQYLLLERRIGAAKYILGRASELVQIATLIYAVTHLCPGGRAATHCALAYVSIGMLHTMRILPECQRVRESPNWKYVLEYLEENAEDGGSTLSVGST